MRTWMYAFQYRNMEQARLTARAMSTPTGKSPCLGCDVCNAQCVNGIPIAQRVTALKQLGLPYA